MKLEAIESHVFPPVEHTYTNKDAMIYALGLGYGSDPLDESQLQFLFEERIKAVPSMCMVLGHPGFWGRDPKFDVNWVKLLHAEQRIEIHQPLAPAGRIIAQDSFLGVQDKGAEKGSLVFQQREIRDAESNALLATIVITLFLRGDGGFGGFGGFGQTLDTPSALSEDKPEITIDIPTLPQSALIYRLSGDWNPIHADPTTARKAGFEQPILHGLCTMGLACRAVLQAYSNDNPERLKTMYARFSKPVYPGETIRFEFFRQGGDIRFRAIALERSTTVLDRGVATLSA